jgi:hypothetical protein
MSKNPDPNAKADDEQRHSKMRGVGADRKASAIGQECGEVKGEEDRQVRGQCGRRAGDHAADREAQEELMHDGAGTVEEKAGESPNGTDDAGGENEQTDP